MRNFEYRPKKEQKDPIAARQELEYGKFSMPDYEKERIISEAKAEGKDPELALREHQEILDRATGRLREKQKEEALARIEALKNPENKKGK